VPVTTIRCLMEQRASASIGSTTCSLSALRLD
jgi:hypothetical protein